MPDFKLRKTIVTVEEIAHDFGSAPARPRLRAACIAVTSNPFAGGWHETLQPAMDRLKPLGLEMSRRLIEALGGRDGIDGYGKGTLVGEAGESSTARSGTSPAATPCASLGESRAIVPSSTKVAGPGATLDVPLGHINAAYVRSHFDAMEVRVPDAPRSHEIVFVLCMAKGPRIHARMGGLAAADIKALDGLR